MHMALIVNVLGLSPTTPTSSSDFSVYWNPRTLSCTPSMHGTNSRSAHIFERIGGCAAKLIPEQALLFIGSTRKLIEDMECASVSRVCLQQNQEKPRLGQLLLPGAPKKSLQAPSPKSKSLANRPLMESRENDIAGFDGPRGGGNQKQQNSPRAGAATYYERPPHNR